MNLNKLYNFTTLVPGILGAEYKNAKLIGMVDFNLANKKINVLATHTSIYPEIKDTVANTPEAFTYYVFTTASGEELVVALEWLDANTITESSETDVYITVHEVSPEDVNTLHSIMKQFGFNNYEITT